MMALLTGQRQGNSLRLPWLAYHGRFIRLRQSKGGKRLRVPVGAPLKAMLDGAIRPAPVILTTIKGTVWTSDGFRTS